MTRRRPTAGVVLGPLLAAVVVGLPACGEASRVRVGFPLPALSFKSLDGAAVDLDTFRGQPLLLNFWATWCQPCLREIPVLKRLEAEGRVRVVGVALDVEGARVVRPFVERMQINYAVLLGSQDVLEHVDGFAIPYTLLLDASLDVVAVHRLPVTRQDIETSLRRIGDHTSPGDAGFGARSADRSE